MGEPATTMNPVLLDPAIYVYFNYDPLIYETPSGTFVPDLATSWGYVGAANKTFKLTIRKGARFSDGSQVTAASVAASLDYFLKTNGPNLSYAGPVAGVTTQGADTVVINYKSSYPNAVISLTQDWNFGLIIGPKGLANPASLATSSDGAGEYVMQASQTTAGSVYTSTPNKYYWNPSAIKYEKVQVKPFTDPPRNSRPCKRARSSSRRTCQLQTSPRPGPRASTSATGRPPGSRSCWRIAPAVRSPASRSARHSNTPSTGPRS